MAGDGCVRRIVCVCIDDDDDDDDGAGVDS